MQTRLASVARPLRASVTAFLAALAASSALALFPPPASATVLVAPSTAQTGELRPLEIEDYYRYLRVGSVGISPDGGWVSYTVSSPVEESNDNLTSAWIVRVDGSGDPQRIRHDGEDVAGPGWLDDGRLRYRHGGDMWAVAPERLGAAEARERYEAPSGLVSPDGMILARTRDMPLESRPAPPLTDFERRHEERFQGAAFDWYPFLRDGQDLPLPDPAEQAMSEIFVEALEGEEAGDPRQLTSLGLRPGSLRWHPDGQTLLFSVNEGILDELSYGTSDLVLVTLEGELTRLTDDGYSYSGADFSPDGEWIAYVRSYGSDMIIEQRLDHGGPRDLYVRRVGGGGAAGTRDAGSGSAPVNLTADWDLDAGSPQWSPDGRHLYFTTGIGGATHLFRVAVEGGPVEQVTTGERRIQGLSIDAGFQRMAYTVGEFDRPPDVWVADMDGSNERRLTDLHADFLAEVEVASHPSQAVHWQSYDGTPVEGFLLFPHGYDPDGGPYPLVVMNHGGPHSASGYGFNFKNQLFAAHGYFVFLPNFRSSTGYGVDFKWGTWGSWGTNDGEDVLSGVDHLIANYPVDPDRVGSTGHSYGGILTNWLITRYPDRFRAAVSGAGESNWTSNYALSDVARTKELEFFGAPWEPRTQEIMIRQSPALNCGGVQAATLFVHGEVDYRVPMPGALQLYTCLKKQGVPAKVILYEGMAHGISGHWNNVHRMMHELGWWDTWLKGDGTAAALEEGGGAGR